MEHLTPENISTFERIFDKHGWAAVFYLTAIVLLVWYVRVKWPKDEERKERWYKEIDSLISGLTQMTVELRRLSNRVHKLYLIIMRAYPDHARNIEAILPEEEKDAL